MQIVGYRGPALMTSAAAAEEWLLVAVPIAIRDQQALAEAGGGDVPGGTARDWAALAREGAIREGMLRELCVRCSSPAARAAA